MAHFSALVIGDGFEEALKPYSEFRYSGEYGTNPDGHYEYWKLSEHRNLVTKDGKTVMQGRVGEIDWDVTDIPSAVVTKDGKWHEEGWRFMDNFDREWAATFKERFVAPLEPDDLVTVVDCHV